MMMTKLKCSACTAMEALPTATTSPSRRLNSSGFVRSKSGIRSPLANGIDLVSLSEREQYKAGIEKLQASKA